MPRHCAGEESEQRFSLTNLDSAFVVEQEGIDSGPANWRKADDVIAFPAEMAAPFVASRIKEWHRRVIVGYRHLDAIRFMQIAAGTGPSKVLDLGTSTKRTRNDVLDVKRSALQRLVHPAVFATSSGASLHLTSNLGP